MDQRSAEFNGTPIEKELLSKSFDPAVAAKLYEERYLVEGSTYLPVTAPLLTKNSGKREILTQETEFPFASSVKSGLDYFIRSNRPRTDLKYEDFDEFHKIWLAYIDELLDNQTTANILSKLASADFHGAILRVVEARNPSLINQQGIVLWEAKTSFVVITRANRIKIFDKKGTMFQVEINSKRYRLIGTRLVYRTCERSNRKFKTHNVSDI